MRLGPILIGAAFATSLAGCATVGRVDLSSQRCGDDLALQIADVLFTQGESRPVADDLAYGLTDDLSTGALSPVSFFADSPSGCQYGFAIHRTSKGCVLRLYYRKRPTSTVTNNLTYIAARPLAGCACSE
jgi:hypothetical protein